MRERSDQVGPVTGVEFFKGTHTLPRREDRKSVDTADNHLLHGFVASNNIQQVAVRVQSQQSAYIACTRVLIDYQHTFSIARQSSREIDHGCSLSRTRTAGRECDNAQV